MARFSRRYALVSMMLGLGLFPLPTRLMMSANGQPAASSRRLPVNLMKPKTRDAVNRGLAFLAARQNEDGSFGVGAYRKNVAIGGLAGMSFLAQGSTPGRGPYGKQVTRSLQFVMAHAQESGFINAGVMNTHGPMYGHGFATLFLAEVYGMSPDPRVRKVLSRAVKLMISTQNKDGGWRYQPQRQDADLSVTICQVMALRAARNAGLHVPNEVIDRCTAYVKRSQNADGGFMYMIAGGESSFPRSAAGVVALYSAGIYEGDEVHKGLAYLRSNMPKTDAFGTATHYFYGHYYAVQAMWHAGGDYWQQWYPRIHDELLVNQQQNGSWKDMICPEYATAMACLVLQMPNNYLPIFRR
ncbi:MAG: terpene cyclase/mutase family protein [Pirellulaceae bacterium]|nr:terpene cyclase/mutase family protein [Pirellulaceae bacterium]